GLSGKIRPANGRLGASLLPEALFCGVAPMDETDETENEPGSTEMPEVAADVVYLDRGGADVIRADTVTLTQSGANQVYANNVRLDQGGIVVAHGDELHVQDGGVAVARINSL